MSLTPSDSSVQYISTCCCTDQPLQEASDKVSDMKEECNKIFKQMHMNEEKSGSSEQLVTVSVSKWMWLCLNCLKFAHLLFTASRMDYRNS